MHWAGFTDSLFVRIKAASVRTKNENVIAPCTRAGEPARRFTLEGCQVSSADPATELLWAARELDTTQRLNSEYVVGTAEAASSSDTTFPLPQPDNVGR